MNRLQTALEKIDAANSADPNRVKMDGKDIPAELAYGQRMSTMQERVYPEASEELRIAARAQHIRRWEVPRSTYPMDRPGYLRWRKDLGRKHAEWTGEILASCGYDEAKISRVGALVRKENFRRDAEAQAVEDIASLVFLAHYADDFAAKHEPEKVVTILAKTLGKMSEHGKTAAGSLNLSPAVRGALEAAIAQAAATS
ncbi:DUF4202 domain-containing protein [Hyphomicrobium sp.]|uniref:DUF4202 domain-containing protein n=1 Tax=Hyphomicrobium sp. TaxID=82 RepID=UPI002E2FC9A9|nr:DUF4202 domain-containing protein [Hyphomicrobium sp.]HEX2842230.1 DUF4202 domain-containing protein [Hyphomicrobium sp.]